MNKITEIEEKFISEAAHYLENPSFLIQSSRVLGNPLEKGLKKLPEKLQSVVSAASEKALAAALKAALMSLRESTGSTDQGMRTTDLHQSLKNIQKTKWLHGTATTLTGILGGFLGIPALPIELPVTTTLMLRSIAQIAAQLGENLSSQETQLECLFVFSLGSREPAEAGAESKVSSDHYFSSRIAFSALAREAIALLSTKGSLEIAEILLKGTSPIFTRIILFLASRFQVVVTEKLLLQAVPIAGAAAGGIINAAFTEHFNQVAKYHFGMKRLEKKYSPALVREVYLSAVQRN